MSATGLRDLINMLREEQLLTGPPRYVEEQHKKFPLEELLCKSPSCSILIHDPAGMLDVPLDLEKHLPDLLWCTQACPSFLYQKQCVSSTCQHCLMSSGKANHQASTVSAPCKGSLPLSRVPCCLSWMWWWCTGEVEVQACFCSVFVLCWYWGYNLPSSCSPDLWLSSEPYWREIFVCLWSFWEPPFPPLSCQHWKCWNIKERHFLGAADHGWKEECQKSQEKSAPDLPITILHSGGMGRVQQSIWAAGCQHSLHSSWGCFITPFDKDNGTKSQGQRKDCGMLQRW